MNTETNTAPSLTIHLRVPVELKATIQKRADAERRPWTQMAILMLSDSAREWKATQPRRGRPAKE